MSGSAEVGLHLGEAAADAAIDDGVADRGHHAPEHGGIDGDLDLDVLAGGVLERRRKPGLLIVGEGDRRTNLGDFLAD